MYMQGGFVVVDGVLASTHSFWLLDCVMPQKLIKHVPAIYQIVFQPIFLAGKLFGVAEVSHFLDSIVPFMRDGLPAFTMGHALSVKGSI